MKAHDIVKMILGDKRHKAKEIGQAYAPVNIALCKYWGKRDEALNLPITASLSLSLPTQGTTTTIKVNEQNQDHVCVNGEAIPDHSPFTHRLSCFSGSHIPSIRRLLVSRS